MISSISLLLNESAALVPASNTLPILLENLSQVMMNIEAVKLRLLTRAQCPPEKLEREIEESIMPQKLKQFIKATLHEYHLETAASEMQLRTQIEDELRQTQVPADG